MLSPNESLKISRVLGAICQELHATAEFTTLRARYGQSKSFLRPLFTDPPELETYFIDPVNYKNFKFCAASFGGGIPVQNKGHIKIQLYPLSQVHGQAGPDSDFPERIARLLRRVELEYFGLHGTVDQLKKVGFCLVVGKTKKSEAEVETSLFQDFLALYFVPTDLNAKSFTETVATKSDSLSTLCDTLFEAMETIEQEDRKEFHLDGLRIVSGLIPKFTNANYSPAAKIAFLRKEFEALLRSHLLGRAPQLSSDVRRTETGDELDAFSRIHFVNINFVRKSEREPLEPTFAVYPRHNAALAPVGAFLISHPKRASIVKYLLYKYALHNDLALSTSFRDLFADLEGEDLIADFGQIFDAECRCILLSSDVHDPLWSRLHQDVSRDGRRSRSIAAFLILRVS